METGLARIALSCGRREPVQDGLAATRFLPSSVDIDPAIGLRIFRVQIGTVFDGSNCERHL
jgi:hypothetical protein